LAYPKISESSLPGPGYSYQQSSKCSIIEKGESPEGLTGKGIHAISFLPTIGYIVSAAFLIGTQAPKRPPFPLLYMPSPSVATRMSVCGDQVAVPHSTA
jgi:hypothetical protein